MAVPTKIADLNTTESSNLPSGSESIGVSLDNYIRATQAILKQTQSKGSNIASGSTIAIPDNGNYFVVTGTTTIAGINDSFNGRISVLKFNDIVTLTDSAGLVLFGTDITTANGDVLTVINESAGVYRALSYSYVSGGYVTLAGTQTLYNKTINAANNTITTAASGGLSATELNAALAELEAEITAIQSFPSGTVMLFRQASAPTGWTKVTTAGIDNSMLRLITTTVYGVGGGSDSPIVMNKVPAHTHGTNDPGTHTHTYSAVRFAGSGGAAQVQAGSTYYSNQTNTGADGDHTHTTNSQSPTAANWLPKYVNLILATKD